jgi:hypothetical protein
LLVKHRDVSRANGSLFYFFVVFHTVGAPLVFWCDPKIDGNSGDEAASTSSGHALICGKEIQMAENKETKRRRVYLRRVPEDLWRQLRAEADESNRTVPGEILNRLRASFRESEEAAA